MSGPGMGNEVSAGEERSEEKEEEDGWTSREEAEVSGGLWSLSHELEDGQELCVFTCTATSSSQAQLCQSGAEHLRLLRHPSIVKFLNYDPLGSPLVLVTEAVLPVSSVMSGMCEEGMVTGWRDIAEGLAFLHDKAKLSHNSICSECVFVCASTSHWKIGGFEAAAQHSKISHTFIETIASIRPPSTVPPEDKSPSPESTPRVPCHSRDVWAFAQFMISMAEEANLSSGVSDSMYTYIQQQMLNVDPTLRPTVAEIMAQPWLRNDVSEIATFLSQLTVKTQSERDEFFVSLPGRLHDLPPRVVAEHLLPLLLTPLVMTEQVARSSLWKHLLTPISSAHPRRMTFDPSRICPLFDEDLFMYHAVPLLLNLMESHDYHVRMVLLEHLLQFAPLCPEDELVDSLLPEVLVGLHDVSDEMVQATLRALADLVGLLGGETVIGTARSTIFADSTPRSRNLPVEKTHPTPTTGSPAAPPTSSPPSQAPPLSPFQAPPLFSSSKAPPSSQEDARRQRAEKMREKREMQRRKKMAATSTKLGLASRVVEVEGAESDELATPTGHAQYSPSVSHDEEDRVNSENAVGGEEEEEEEEEEEGDDVEEEWEDFTEEGGEVGEWGDGGEWGGKREEESWNTTSEGSWLGQGRKEETEVALETREEETVQKKKERRRGSRENGGALRLGKKHVAQNKKEEEVGEKEKEVVGEKKKEMVGQKKEMVGGREKNSWSRSRLSEADRQRLEEQAAWNTEPDFFADMTPTVTKTTSSLGVESPTPAGKSSSLQYQPTEQEEEEGWGGWNDF